MGAGDSLYSYKDEADLTVSRKDVLTVRQGGIIRTRTPVDGLPDDPPERKKWQLWTFLTEYFPDAFLAVVDVAIKGNDQHNPGEPLHWAREKSTDQMNTAFRHIWDHGRGQLRDTDDCYHLAKAIWRLSAELQLVIERERALASGRVAPG